MEQLEENSLPVTPSAKDVIFEENGEQHEGEEKQIKWTETETLNLLETLRRYQINTRHHVDMREFLWKKVVFEINKGAKRQLTYRQCQNKYNGMKRTFRSLIESGRESKGSWPYFSVMEEVLSCENEPSLDEDSRSSSENISSLRFRWPLNATLLMLEEIKRSGAISVRPIQWLQVTKKLLKHGYNVTVAQCNSKFAGLKRTYNSILALNHKYRRHWPYFKLMDELLNNGKYFNFFSHENDDTCFSGEFDNTKNIETETTDEISDSDDKMKWTYDAVIALIAELKSEDVLKAVHSGCLWQHVADKMVQNGFKVTPQQCYNKLFGLKRIYQSFVGVSTKVKLQWPYYEITEELLNSDNYSWISAGASSHTSNKNTCIEEKESNENYSDYYDAEFLDEEDFIEECDNYEPSKKERKRSHGSRWSRKALSILITAVKSALKPTGLGIKEKLWKRIECKLSAHGIQQSSPNCRLKWSKLLSDYYAAKKYKRKCQYFDIIHEILQSTELSKMNVIENNVRSDINKTVHQIPQESLDEYEVLQPDLGHSFKKQQKTDAEKNAVLLEAIFGNDVDACPLEVINADGISACRCCLSPCDQMPEVEENVLNALLQMVADLQSEVSGLLPHTICQRCYDQAVSLYKFRLRCQRANRILSEVVRRLYGRTVDENKVSTDNDETLVIIVSEEKNENKHSLELIDEKNDRVSSLIDICTSAGSKEKFEPLNSEVVSDLLDLSRDSVMDCSDRGDNMDHILKWKSALERKRTRWSGSHSKYLCPQTDCFKVFSQFQQLRHHLRYHGNRNNLCGICNKAFFGKTDLLRHSRCHSSQLNIYIRCRYCNTVLSDNDIFHLHYELIGNDSSRSIAVEAIVVLPSSVTAMEALSYKIDANILDKMNENTGVAIEEVAYLCDCCGGFFNNTDDYVLHVSSNKNDELICMECDKTTFSSKDEFMVHMTNYHKSKSYSHQCDQCGKMFRTKTTLEIHTTTHNQQLCGVCGRTVPAGDSFRRHMMRHENYEKHTRQARYACSVCSLSCPDRQTLMSHIARKHDGVRRFKCKSCEKAFWTLGNLKEHEHRHLGEKPFTCKDCGLNVVSARALLLHERARHSGYKPHHCHLCRVSFISINRKNVHMKVKHGKADIVCQTCGKMFHLQTTLRTHIRKVHERTERRRHRRLIARTYTSNQK